MQCILIKFKIIMLKLSLFYIKVFNEKKINLNFWTNVFILVMKEKSSWQYLWIFYENEIKRLRDIIKKLKLHYIFLNFKMVHVTVSQLW